MFAALTLIVFGIVWKYGWTTPAIAPENIRTTEQLQNILDLVRDQRWTTARQAIETYEKSALSDSERQQAADVRTRFEKSARTRVEQALATAVELVGAGRITDARLVLEQAKEPAAACGWNDRLATALSKLPTT